VGEIFSVTARTGPGNRGITSLLVTKDTVDLDEAKRVGRGPCADLPKIKGVRAGKKEDKMGWRASDTRELVFEDAVIPRKRAGEGGRRVRQLPEDARCRPDRHRGAVARHRGRRI
jgi:butyryl-CoA dehydrogenase